MRSSHQGLGITEGDWDATLAHLVASLDRFKVPEREKREVLRFFAAAPMKQQIVDTRPAARPLSTNFMLSTDMMMPVLYLINIESDKVITVDMSKDPRWSGGSAAAHAGDT